MPDNTSGLVAVHATREYYARKIAALESRIEDLEYERQTAYAAGRVDAADQVRKMYMLGNATCAELTSAAQGGYTLEQTLPLDPMLGDGALGAIQRVRKLHREVPVPLGGLTMCRCCGYEYPCPTIAALDGSHE